MKSKPNNSLGCILSLIEVVLGPGGKADKKPPTQLLLLDPWPKNKAIHTAAHLLPTHSPKQSSSSQLPPRPPTRPSTESQAGPTGTRRGGDHRGGVKRRNIRHFCRVGKGLGDALSKWLLALPAPRTQWPMVPPH